ncbi:MAG: LD-carboxypeptidase [Saprospiraceae bacterium]|nr:LD-carboxypeptidase [Saprospiraceae bacterium]
MRSFSRSAFLKLTGLAALGSSSALPSMFATSGPRLIRPKRLREGATIALIAPSSPPADEKITKALSNLKTLGFQVVEGKSLRVRTGFLAGADKDRLADLHDAFLDPAIDAVWCVRGGYGAGRLLPSLNYNLIKKHPKLLIGFSDITALHIAIHQRTGLITMHGPVGASEFVPETLGHLKTMIMDGTSFHPIQAIPDNTQGAEFQPYTIHPGEAEGVLTGGNLTLLAALTGTPFTPVFKNKVVFLEDVGEQPYRIDRMLTQLLQGTDLKEAAGIALGVFFDCAPKPDSFSFSLRETLEMNLSTLRMPVVYGMPFGHVTLNATLPYGVRAKLDTTNQRLTLLEAAVE